MPTLQPALQEQKRGLPPLAEGEEPPVLPPPERPEFPPASLGLGPAFGPELFPDAPPAPAKTPAAAAPTPAAPAEGAEPMAVDGDGATEAGNDEEEGAKEEEPEEPRPLGPDLLMVASFLHSFPELLGMRPPPSADELAQVGSSDLCVLHFGCVWTSLHRWASTVCVHRSVDVCLWQRQSGQRAAFNLFHHPAPPTPRPPTIPTMARSPAAGGV